MAKTVIVFDFDKTIIDCDSDNWVVDDLGATDRFDALLLTMPWNSAIDQMMTELNSQGKTIKDIADSLKRAPLHPSVIRAIKSAYVLGCELWILSDANRYFVETVLDHHGLTDYFTGIDTNPGFIDEEGKLRITPYHDFINSSHGCGLGICPPNMCKGLVMERIRERGLAEGKKKFVYLGDGRGDYCPSIKLREDDYVMPRTNYPLWDLICENPNAVRANLREWGSAEDLEAVLARIINSDDAGVVMMDCKFQTMLPSAHELLLQALPAPN